MNLPYFRYTFYCLLISSPSVLFGMQMTKKAKRAEAITENAQIPTLMELCRHTIATSSMNTLAAPSKSSPAPYVFVSSFGPDLTGDQDVQVLPMPVAPETYLQSSKGLTQDGITEILRFFDGTCNQVPEELLVKLILDFVKVSGERMDFSSSDSYFEHVKFALLLAEYCAKKGYQTSGKIGSQKDYLKTAEDRFARTAREIIDGVQNYPRRHARPFAIAYFLRLDPLMLTYMVQYSRPERGWISFLQLQHIKQISCGEFLDMAVHYLANRPEKSGQPFVLTQKTRAHLLNEACFHNRLDIIPLCKPEKMPHQLVHIALMHALIAKRNEAVQKVVELCHGAIPQGELPENLCRFHTCFCEQHSALALAVHSRNMPMVQFLISSGADLTEGAIKAMQANNEVLDAYIAIILQRGTKIDTVLDEKNYSLAVEDDQWGLIRLLCEYTAVQSQHLTALIKAACEKKKLPVLDFILDSAIANYEKAHWLKRAFVIALETGDSTVVKHLIAKGAPIHKHFKKDKIDILPLHFAAANGFADIVTVLLEHNAHDCVFREQKPSACTALSLALDNDQEEVVKVLIQHPQSQSLFHLAYPHDNLVPARTKLFTHALLQDKSNFSEYFDAAFSQDNTDLYDTLLTHPMMSEISAVRPLLRGPLLKTEKYDTPARWQQTSSHNDDESVQQHSMTPISNTALIGLLISGTLATHEQSCTAEPAAPSDHLENTIDGGTQLQEQNNEASQDVDDWINSVLDTEQK